MLVLFSPFSILGNRSRAIAPLDKISRGQRHGEVEVALVVFCVFDAAFRWRHGQRDLGAAAAVKPGLDARVGERVFRKRELYSATKLEAYELQVLIHPLLARQRKIGESVPRHSESGRRAKAAAGEAEAGGVDEIAKRRD